MKKQMIAVYVDEYLREEFDMFKEEKEIEKDSEALRNILEQFFEVPEEVVEEYKEKSKRSMVRSGPNKKKSRKKLLIKLKKSMEPGRYYSLNEISKVSGLSRKLVKEIAFHYYDHFELKSVVSTAKKEPYQIRRFTRAEREEYKIQEQIMIERSREMLRKRREGK